jgi:hypothetical protein
MLGVDAALAALVGEGAVGDGEGRGAEDVADGRVPGGAGLAGSGAMPAAATSASLSSERNISPV